MASVMQARFGERQYPIGRLVLHQARARGLSRTDIVQRLGYTDLSSGHRALTDVMMTGTVPRFFTRLTDALEAERSIVDAAIAATVRQQQAEAAVHLLAREDTYQQEFRPHLQVQTERRVPSPIFVAALLTVRRLLIVQLEPLPHESGERDDIVRRIITKHYGETAGQIPAFGRITGYVLVLIAGYGAADFGVPFDCNGKPAVSMIEIRRLPEAMLGNGRLNDASEQAVAAAPQFDRR